MPVQVGGAAPTAYVVPLDDQREGALMQTSTVTIQLLGNFSKTDVALLAQSL